MDALSLAAHAKDDKKAGDWSSLSKINRAPKSNIRFSTDDGVEMDKIVKVKGSAGQPSSRLKFRKGEIFSQDEDTATL